MAQVGRMLAGKLKASTTKSNKMFASSFQKKKTCISEDLYSMDLSVLLTMLHLSIVCQLFGKQISNSHYQRSCDECQSLTRPINLP
jgi:hypothetical protein